MKRASDECLIQIEDDLEKTEQSIAIKIPSKPVEYRIRLDMRETGIRAAMPFSPLIAALPVGDVWIGCSGDEVAANGIILERKTVADFDASIKDGRYDEQRGRMLAYAQERGAKVAYVVEGHLERSSLGPVALYNIGDLRTEGRRWHSRGQEGKYRRSPSICSSYIVSMSRYVCKGCRGFARRIWESAKGVICRC